MNKLAVYFNKEQIGYEHADRYDFLIYQHIHNIEIYSI